MFTSASPSPTHQPPRCPRRTRNTKALLYVLKHTSGYFTPPTEAPQTLRFSSRLLYTKRDEWDKPSTALHYTQLWNQFDIDPGKLRCFPVFGQWLSFAILLGMLVISRHRGKRQAGRQAGSPPGEPPSGPRCCTPPCTHNQCFPHRSCPASTLFTISLLGATVYTFRLGSRNSGGGQKKI